MPKLIVKRVWQKQSNHSRMLKKQLKKKQMKRVNNMKILKKLNASKQKRLQVKCKRSLNVLCISILVSMMTGCASSTKLVIPANLKTPCPDLQTLKSGQGKDVMPIMIDDRRKYVDCQQRHAAVISIVEKPSK